MRDQRQLVIGNNRHQTVSRIMTAFFASKSAHTVRAYQQDLGDFAHFLERLFMVRLTQPEAIRAFLSQGVGSANEIVINYRADLEARGRSPATINRHIAALRSLTKLSRMLGVISWSIEVSGVRAETYQDMRGPGVDAVRRMLTVAQERTDRKGLRDYAMLRVLFDLALRVGEVVRLDLSDFEREGRGLWVLGKARRQKELLELPHVTHAAIIAWIRERGTHEGPLFTALSTRYRRDHRLTERALYRFVRGFGSRVWIKVWPHALRHTSITEAVKAAPANGIGLEEVRQFSRHRNINTLLIYRDRERNVQGRLASEVADRVGAEAPTSPPSPKRRACYG